MKKIMSLLLVFVMVLVIAPVPAHAASSTEKDIRSEVLETACDVFPEYADKIMAQAPMTANARSASTTRDLVVSESRTASDNRVIVYSEYSDGLVLLADYGYRYTTTFNDNTIDGNKTYVDLTVRAFANYFYGYFEMRNVQITIFGPSYDKITNVGTTYATGDCEMYELETQILNETASTKATIQYELCWRLVDLPAGLTTSRIKLEVGNNNIGVTHWDNV